MDTRTMPNRSIAKDKNGVVMAAYGGTLGNQYNPVTISQAAITYYYAAVNSTESGRPEEGRPTALLVQADWLVAHQDATGRWLYRFPLGEPARAVGLGDGPGHGDRRPHPGERVRPDARYTRAIAKSGRRSTATGRWAASGRGCRWARSGTSSTRSTWRPTRRTR
jgi:hypothetical protein